MTMVFQICATSFSNPAGAKSAGYIDCVVEAGSGCVQPPGGFITACHGQGMGALMQNSDSGSGGCSDTSYLSGLASAGLDAVGGESEGGAEIDAIMQYLPFMNYGGEGTGGTTGNNCVWSSCGGNDGASVGKYGCSTFLETYTTDSMLSASEIGQEAGMNYDAGCFEVGILVGSWSYGDYGAGVSTYQEMVDEIASQSKKPCVGFQWWYVEGDGSGAPSNDSGGVMASYPLPQGIENWGYDALKTYADATIGQPNVYLIMSSADQRTVVNLVENAKRVEDEKRRVRERDALNDEMAERLVMMEFV